MKRILYFVSIVLFALSSCSEDDECNSGPLEVITIQDIGCQTPAQQLSINSNKEFELIRNQDQYLNILSTSCRLDIDWEVYDMIAGTINLSNGLLRLDQTAFYDCKENKLDITIMVFLNDTTVALPIGFAFLIPKLNDSETPYVSIVKQ